MGLQCVLDKTEWMVWKFWVYGVGGIKRNGITCCTVIYITHSINNWNIVGVKKDGILAPECLFMNSNMLRLTSTTAYSRIFTKWAKNIHMHFPLHALNWRKSVLLALLNWLCQLESQTEITQNNRESFFVGLLLPAYHLLYAARTTTQWYCQDPKIF